MYSGDMAKRKLSAEFREYFSRLGKKGGSKGGHARAAKMTKEQRSEASRKAVNARWAKQKAKSSTADELVATIRGTLESVRQEKGKPGEE